MALLARTEAEIDALARELEAATAGRSRVRAVRCDVSDARSVHDAVAEAERALGPADILVNAAGDAVSAPLARTDDELWHRLLAVNLTGTFLMIREVATGMVQRGAGGRIVNIASVAGLTGAPYVSAYSAAKHGVVGLTRCLSQELAKSGITVNAVCPGYVETSLTDRSVANIVQRTGMSEDQARSALAGRSPQNRMITSQEVAALVLHLLSEVGRGINGQALVIDGGGLVA